MFGIAEVHAILRCGGLSPHRVVGWLHSPDAEFAARSKRVAELYVSPPPGAVVLSVDEKTGIQATRRVHPNHAGPRGHLRREFEYVRGGTTTMIAALNVTTSHVHAVCKRRTRANFLAFLDGVIADYPKGDVYIVVDNLNIHTGPEISAWCARHRGRVRFVYTPRHASWLNQIEIWFSILQRRVLRYGCFADVKELEHRLKAFVRYYNRFEAKPFRWRFRGEFRGHGSWHGSCPPPHLRRPLDHVPSIPWTMRAELGARGNSGLVRSRGPRSSGGRAYRGS